MNKPCGVCNKLIENEQIVVALILGRYTAHDDRYEIEPHAQAIVSHFKCPILDSLPTEGNK